MVESAALADPRLRRRRTPDEATLDGDEPFRGQLAAHMPGHGEAGSAWRSATVVLPTR